MSPPLVGQNVAMFGRMLPLLAFLITCCALPVLFRIAQRALRTMHVNMMHAS